MHPGPADAQRRPIVADERSGVLHPTRLARYAASWIEPASEVSAAVDRYWHVSWALEDGERLDQRIIDLPAVTVTAESGDVPAPLVITGVHSGVWRRTIQGVGRVFAIRLRPAGLAALSDLTPAAVADRTVPLTAGLDERLHTLMRAVAREVRPADKARRADRLIAELLAERAPTRTGLLANEVLDEIRSRVRHRTGSTLAQRFARSERTIQRVLAETIGHGPKWISRRIRLQEVALALIARPDDDLSRIAADLGYSDHSHLTSDFRAVAGVSPDAYRREVRRLQAGDEPRPPERRPGDDQGSSG